MKSNITWRGTKLSFDTIIRQHQFIMDAAGAAGGDDEGPNPKELVLAALCGCSGMDVVSLLKKAKVHVEALAISAEAETTHEHPRVFKEVHMTFAASGAESVRASLIDAVAKSESIYCGVAAMLSKAVTIHYRVTLNDTLIHEADATFPP